MKLFGICSLFFLALGVAVYAVLAYTPASVAGSGCNV